MEERRKKERNMHEPAEHAIGCAHGVHQLEDEALPTFNNNNNKEHQITNSLPDVGARSTKSPTPYPMWAQGAPNHQQLTRCERAVVQHEPAERDVGLAHGVHQLGDGVQHKLLLQHALLQVLLQHRLQALQVPRVLGRLHSRQHGPCMG